MHALSFSCPFFIFLPFSFIVPAGRRTVGNSAQHHGLACMSFLPFLCATLAVAGAAFLFPFIFPGAPFSSSTSFASSSPHASSAAPSTRFLKMHALLAWAGDKAHLHSKVKMVEDRLSGIGFEVTREGGGVKEGETILAVDASLFLCSDSQTEEIVYDPADKTKQPKLPPRRRNHYQVMLKLLWEKNRGEASPWAAYVGSLPARHDMGHVGDFDAPVLSLVYHSRPTVWQAFEANLMAFQEYELFMRQEVCLPFSAALPAIFCDKDEQTWAYLIVQSRLFGYLHTTAAPSSTSSSNSSVSSPPVHRHCLIPLADLVNHMEQASANIFFIGKPPVFLRADPLFGDSSPSSLSSANSNGNMFLLNAARYLRPASPVLHVYTRKACVSMFFFIYGFFSSGARVMLPHPFDVMYNSKDNMLALSSSSSSSATSKDSVVVDTSAARWGWWPSRTPFLPSSPLPSAFSTLSSTSIEQDLLLCDNYDVAAIDKRCLEDTIHELPAFSSSASASAIKSLSKSILPSDSWLSLFFQEHMPSDKYIHCMRLKCLASAAARPPAENSSGQENVEADVDTLARLQLRSAQMLDEALVKAEQDFQQHTADNKRSPNEEEEHKHNVFRIKQLHWFQGPISAQNEALTLRAILALLRRELQYHQHANAVEKRLFEEATVGSDKKKKEPSRYMLELLQVLHYEADALQRSISHIEGELADVVARVSDLVPACLEEAVTFSLQQLNS